MKKIISLTLSALLTALMIFGVMPIVSAATYVTFGDWLLEVKSDTSYLVAGYSGTATEIVLPSSANDKDIVGVAEDFYDRCDSDLTSVTLPESYTVIGSFAFYNMSNLSAVNFPPALNSIGEMAFYGCSSISAVDLSAATGMKNIPYACFADCALLSSISFPKNITTISDYAFSNTALQSVELFVGLTSIGDYSFNGCSSLSSVVLPNGIVSIGESAFYNDTALTSIYIPASVSSIGANAFAPMAFDGGTLTLDCYDGTYAATYAYNNFLNYSGDTLVKGDANNDGEVNIRDVTYIQLYRAGLYHIPDDVKTIDRVDVTGDYEVTIRDATKIQMYRAQLIDSL